MSRMFFGDGVKASPVFFGDGAKVPPVFFGDGVKVSSVFFFGMALRCPLCSIFVKSSFLVFF